jgi:hypothetical protein
LLKQVFPNWYKEIKSWDIKKFNEFFSENFYLEPVEVYGVNYWGWTYLPPIFAAGRKIFQKILDKWLVLYYNKVTKNKGDKKCWL